MPVATVLVWIVPRCHATARLRATALLVTGYGCVRIPAPAYTVTGYLHLYIYRFTLRFTATRAPGLPPPRHHHLRLPLRCCPHLWITGCRAFRRSAVTLLYGYCGCLLSFCPIPRLRGAAGAHTLPTHTLYTATGSGSVVHITVVTPYTVPARFGCAFVIRSRYIYGLFFALCSRIAIHTPFHLLPFAVTSALPRCHTAAVPGLQFAAVTPCRFLPPVTFYRSVTTRSTHTFTVCRTHLRLVYTPHVLPACTPAFLFYGWLLRLVTYRLRLRVTFTVAVRVLVLRFRLPTPRFYVHRCYPRSRLHWFLLRLRFTLRAVHRPPGSPRTPVYAPGLRYLPTITSSIQFQFWLSSVYIRWFFYYLYAHVTRFTPFPFTGWFAHVYRLFLQFTTWFAVTHARFPHRSLRFTVLPVGSHAFTTLRLRIRYLRLRTFARTLAFTLHARVPLRTRFTPFAATLPHITAAVGLLHYGLPRLRSSAVTAGYLPVLTVTVHTILHGYAFVIRHNTTPRGCGWLLWITVTTLRFTAVYVTTHTTRLHTVPRFHAG